MPAMKPMTGHQQTSGDTNSFSCPSSKCETGAKLIGIVGEDGRVGHLATALTVDADFARKAAAQHNDGVPAERRFRFSGRCEEARCKQWTGSACGVIDRVMNHLEHLGIETDDRLPPCTIRADCRWYSQRGNEACRACVFVVTDNRPRADG